MESSGERLCLEARRVFASARKLAENLHFGASATVADSGEPAVAAPRQVALCSE